MFDLIPFCLSAVYAALDSLCLQIDHRQVLYCFSIWTLELCTNQMTHIIVWEEAPVSTKDWAFSQKINLEILSN